MTEEPNGFIRRHEFEVSETYNSSKHEDMDRDVESLAKRMESEIVASKDYQAKLHESIDVKFAAAIEKAESVDLRTSERLINLGTRIDEARKETLLAASTTTEAALLAGKEAQAKTYDLEKHLTETIAESKVEMQKFIGQVGKDLQTVISNVEVDFTAFKMKMMWWVLGIAGSIVLAVVLFEFTTRMIK